MTKEQKRIYKTFYAEMMSIESFNDLEDDKIDYFLDKLLYCLPNNGKLYKYRTFDNESLKLNYKAIKEGYIWIPKANELNDDFDTTLKVNLEEDFKKFYKILFTTPEIIAKMMITPEQKQIIDISNSEDKKIMQDVMGNFDVSKMTFNRNRTIKYLVSQGFETNKAVSLICDIDEKVQNIVETDTTLKSNIEKIINYNNYMRANTSVFSMSETNNNEAMWAYYSKNDGYCVEYDFNLIRNLSYDIKRLFIRTFKINYVANRKNYSFIPLIFYKMTNTNNDDYLSKLSQEFNQELLTKTSDWKHEKEWRLFLFKFETHKIDADIVSSIIIDIRGIEQGKAKPLLQLCKQKNIAVKVRKTNTTNTKHLIENYVN